MVLAVDAAAAAAMTTTVELQKCLLDDGAQGSWSYSLRAFRSVWQASKRNLLVLE